MVAKALNDRLLKWLPPGNTLDAYAAPRARRRANPDPTAFAVGARITGLIVSLPKASLFRPTL